MPEHYDAYLASPAWREFRIKVLRKHRRCFTCGTRKRLTLHHLSYERLGSELESDVLVLCHDHHLALHDELKRRYPRLSTGQQIKHSFAVLRELFGVRPPRRPSKRKLNKKLRREARKRKHSEKVKQRKIAAKNANQMQLGKGQSRAELDAWRERCHTAQKPLVIRLAPLPTNAAPSLAAQPPNGISRSEAQGVPDPHQDAINAGVIQSKGPPDYWSYAHAR